MNPKALFTISYGLFIVTSKLGDRINGQTANTVFQISNEPPTIAASINKNNLTHQFIKESGAFAVSVLAQDAPLSLIGQFGFKSGRDADKFSGIQHQTTPKGLPYIAEGTLAWIEAEVINSFDAGTHTIFLGKITDAEVLKDGPPMTYAYYHQVKKGGTPPAAPLPPQVEEMPAATVDSYRCTVCGYVYDPAAGDPDGGIPPGTPFEELPDDWTCPVCGAGKDEFEKI